MTPRAAREGDGMPERCDAGLPRTSGSPSRRRYEIGAAKRGGREDTSTRFASSRTDTRRRRGFHARWREGAADPEAGRVPVPPTAPAPTRSGAEQSQIPASPGFLPKRAPSGGRIRTSRRTAPSLALGYGPRTALPHCLYCRSISFGSYPVDQAFHPPPGRRVRQAALGSAEIVEQVLDRCGPRYATGDCRV